jgi:hypothetical protein
MTTHQAAHVAVLEAIRNAYAAMVCPTAFDKVRALDAAIELMKQAGEPMAWLVLDGRVWADAVYLTQGMAERMCQHRSDGSRAVPPLRHPDRGKPMSREPKFKKGDRVRLLVAQRHSDAGQVGTVLERSQNPFVQFDTPTRWECGVPSLGGGAGFCDCVNEDDLEALTASPQAAPEGFAFDALVVDACKAAYSACDMGSFPEQAVYPESDKRFIAAALRVALASPQVQGGECHHRWQPEIDLDGALYCSKCNATRDLLASGPSGVDGLIDLGEHGELRNATVRGVRVVCARADQVNGCTFLGVTAAQDQGEGK